jgi:shikimate kinase
MVRTIAIGGFMGVGKTTAAKALASRLGVEFVDLDARISLNSGMSVCDIFTGQGESAFRRIESETLASVLAQPPLVLALGGGTLHQLGNRDLLTSSLVVCLLMSFEEIRARIGTASRARPLWASASTLYESRLALYEAEEHILRVDGLSEGAVVDRLEELSRCT